MLFAILAACFWMRLIRIHLLQCISWKHWACPSGYAETCQCALCMDHSDASVISMDARGKCRLGSMISLRPTWEIYSHRIWLYQVQDQDPRNPIPDPFSHIYAHVCSWSSRRFIRPHKIVPVCPSACSRLFRWYYGFLVDHLERNVWVFLRRLRKTQVFTIVNCFY